jgi:MSHA pilin protein MshC
VLESFKPEVTGTRQRGFTIIELIVTMIIVGIMAVVALPRFEGLGAFDARGAGDQVASYLRFAQKSALAQRRHVQVSGLKNVTAGPTLKLFSGSACSGTETLLVFPGRFSPVRSSTSATGDDSVCFDTMGGVAATATTTFSADGTARKITVEAVTGFIHAS